MPDSTHAQAALRRLVDVLVRENMRDRPGAPPLGPTELADLQTVLDALGDAERERPRYAYVAKHDHDHDHSGRSSTYLVLDLIGVDVHHGEADTVAECSTVTLARTVTGNLNAHPPVPDYDIEPF